MVLVDQVPSYPHAVSLPPPPPAIATAVLGVPTTTSSSLGGGGGGGAATGIPAAPSTNRTAFLGAHLGVRASPLEAFVSTDPSDYAYGAERALVLLAVVLTVVVFLVENGGPLKRKGGDTLENASALLPVVRFLPRFETLCTDEETTRSSQRWEEEINHRRGRNAGVICVASGSGGGGRKKRVERKQDELPARSPLFPSLDPLGSPLPNRGLPRSYPHFDRARG